MDSTDVFAPNQTETLESASTSNKLTILSTLTRCHTANTDCENESCLQVAVDCKMAMDIEDYATSFRPDIIDAVSGWCQGATFAKILTLTDIFEVSTSMFGSHTGCGNCCREHQEHESWTS